MNKIVFLAVFLISEAAFSQRIENLRATVVQNTVEIRYDLAETDPEQTFDVLLFSSVNKFTKPLERVTGDLGKNIKPGKNKLVVWSPESELVKFRGEVVFELQVNVFMPFLSVLSPLENDVIRRGATKTIEWKGANANTKLQLELYHEDVKLSTIESTENTGKFKWLVSKNLKPGSGYKIAILDANKIDNRAFSNAFVIKRKIPNAIKISASVIGAGLLGYVFTQIGSQSKQPAKISPPPNPN